MGLLSWRKYYPESGANNFYNLDKSHNALATYVDFNNNLNLQRDNQFIYIQDTSSGANIYHSGNTDNGSWALGYDFSDVTVDGGGILESNYNIGLSGLSSEANDDGLYQTPINILGSNETGSIVGPVYWTGQTDLLCTAHPYIENIDNFIYSDESGEKLLSAQEKFIMPIKIFFQLRGESIDDEEFVNISSTTTSSISRIKKLRFFVEPDNLSRPFEFEIVFRIYRNRTFNIKTHNPDPAAGGGATG